MIKFIKNKLYLRKLKKSNKQIDIGQLKKFGDLLKEELHDDLFKVRFEQETEIIKRRKDNEKY